MSNTKKTTNRADAKGAAVERHNANAVSKLLDIASKKDFILLLDDVLEAYLTSDIFAWDEAENRQNNYSLARELHNFFNSVRS